MSLLDTRWGRVRRRLGPLTRRVPYGHVLSESAVCARLLVPGVQVPQRRFVIFAQGRSGSTLLTELMNSHPQVFCADEPLTWKRRDPVRYAKACSVGHRGDTYGFKVKIYQLTDAQQVDPQGFLRRMHEEQWQIVHLHRRNVLRQALSSMVAEQRRVYHEPAGGAGPRRPVRIDPGELVRRTDERAGFGVQEQRALDGLPHLRLEYEQDLLPPGQHEATSARVFDFLGLRPVPVSTRTSKIGDRPLSALLTNADEVEAAVRSSVHAHLLDEP